MLAIRSFALAAASFVAIVSLSALAFAQDVPPDPSTADIVKLIASGQWLPAVIPLLVIVDRALSKGEWPFSLIVSAKVRLALVCVGSAAIAGLQMFVGGSAWLPSLLAGLASLISALVMNGKTLVGAPAESPKAPMVPPLPLFTVLLCLAGGAVFVVTGCKAVTSAEPVVVRSVDEACSVVTMMSTSGLVHAFCVGFDDLVAIERELLAAQAAGRSARLRVAGIDGSTVDVEVDARHLEEALQNVSKAKLAAGHR